MTSGTQPRYTVDVWSGNHPFFKGASSAMVLDEGRVNRFKRRYAGLEQMSDMSTMKAGQCLVPQRCMTVSLQIRGIVRKQVVLVLSRCSGVLRRSVVLRS